MTLGEQLTWLFVLAAPVACVAWTVTHEDVFAELRELCEKKSRRCKALLKRKFFYVFTCEYCLSHYVAAAFVGLSDFRLLLTDWRGLLIAWFAVVWIANVYMSMFGRLRLDIKRERVEIEVQEDAAEEAKVTR
ncbi:MAG: hypothetical protein A3J29_02025 [Acidobacteria bacterium RIFCSPLOWO2_12_FULL_67_14b]|nr:MAG: hypothetical protein A3J29_02025 [Acidobacteria bacterium RIFCSPLOWO2_12_FULL_67_14b]